MKEELITILKRAKVNNEYEYKKLQNYLLLLEHVIEIEEDEGEGNKYLIEKVRKISKILGDYGRKRRNEMDIFNPPEEWLREEALAEKEAEKERERMRRMKEILYIREKQKMLPNSSAYMDVDFVEHNINTFTEKQKRFLLYIISQIENTTNKVFVDISKITKLDRKKNFGIKWKRSHQDLDNFMEELSKLQVVFDTNIVRNKKTIPNRINWFQSIKPIYEKGVKGYEIEFSKEILPFIYYLEKEYIQVSSVCISKLSGKYSIELYLKLLAVYEKQKKHRDLVSYTIEVSKFKKLLGIDDDDKVAYQEYKRFKSKVIEPAIKNINDCSSIYVWYRQHGKPVHTLAFYINKKTL